MVAAKAWRKAGKDMVSRTLLTRSSEGHGRPWLMKRESVEASEDGGAGGQRFEHHQRKSFIAGGNDQRVECLIEAGGVAPGQDCGGEMMLVNERVEGGGVRAVTGEYEVAGSGECGITGDGCDEEMLLLLAELDATDHAEAGLVRRQVEFQAGVERIAGLESVGIDPVIDDVDGCGGSTALEEFGHLIGDGDERIRKMEQAGGEKIAEGT